MIAFAEKGLYDIAFEDSKNGVRLVSDLKAAQLETIIEWYQDLFQDNQPADEPEGEGSGEDDGNGTEED